MLEIKKTTVTNEAFMETENAKYNVIYTIESQMLRTVTASIITTQMVEVPDAEGNTVQQPQEMEIGQLILEDSTFKTYSLPYSDKLPAYVGDFIKIINEIVKPTPEVVE
ncbi:hypothetical protein [Parabacteroides pacaensis]|uniref:hypothetical protein n=1 Tax=Parabacteroides pacaensis TaxID=2086575 RepID=UPI000D103161|nr:hypothetical protein [Parabacteroides pacaensis]